MIVGSSGIREPRENKARSDDVAGKSVTLDRANKSGIRAGGMDCAQTALNCLLSVPHG